MRKEIETTETKEKKIEGEREVESVLYVHHSGYRVICQRVRNFVYSLGFIKISIFLKQITRIYFLCFL